MKRKATIEHHNGSADVEGFSSIEEIDEEQNTIRVFYDEQKEGTSIAYTKGGEVYYKEFTLARVTEVSIVESEDRDGGGSDYISIDT